MHIHGFGQVARLALLDTTLKKRQNTFPALPKNDETVNAEWIDVAFEAGVCFSLHLGSEVRLRGPFVTRLSKRMAGMKSIFGSGVRPLRRLHWE